MTNAFRTEPFSRGLLAPLLSIGARPDEDVATRVARSILVLGGFLMSGGGLLWGTLSLAFGLWRASLIPFGYIVLTAGNFVAFAVYKRFSAARLFQVFISLALPFAFQWALGGFAASGAVMLWATVSIIGALTFSSAREAALWLFLYCGFTVVSGVIDPYLPGTTVFSPSQPEKVSFLVLNIVVVSAIVFGLAIYQNALRDRALRSLEAANRDNEELNEHLQERQRELAASLDALHHTQDELIQREKLAALGNLVAGVAHEVNTPLGVVYTALTMSHENARGLHQSLQANPLSRGKVLAGLQEIIDPLEIAEKNAVRAAKLIEDFKRISVDRTSEAEDTVELYSYLEALLSSLSPMIRKGNLEVHLSGEPISLRTRPGAIAAAVTNLIQNVGLHAYAADVEDRRVDLRCFRDGSTAVIEVEDHGCGMSSAIAATVFEPFMTTKRGQGGSGLGLHIVHQQMVSLVGGSLHLDTEPGRGSKFTLRIPLDGT